MAGCYVAFHKQLGDLVLLEPALSRLRAHHGGPIRLMTRTGHADLVALIPGVEPVRGAALIPARRLYSFDPLNKSAFRALLAPVLERCLICPEQRELQWYHRLLFLSHPHPEIGTSYVAEFFWENTPVPTSESFRAPVLERPPQAWAPGNCPEGSFILVNPTAGWKRKMWTVEGWVEVLRSLGSGHRFVITHAGAEWQKAHAEAIAARTGAVIASTTLREYLWLCAHARAVLTVDGAASHLAGAFGVKCFTLFGPTSLAQWHRAAPGHIAFQAPADANGQRRLRDLDPAPVVEALAALELSTPC
jgi:ADP-heptose:LPS heptosyltransferase